MIGVMDKSSGLFVAWKEAGERFRSYGGAGGKNRLSEFIKTTPHVFLKVEERKGAVEKAYLITRELNE